ncbi:MAG: DUF2911 domain-containing protein [Cytophagales bacterium]
MKLLKYLLFLIILIVLGFAIYTYFTPPASPKDESTYTFNNKNYKVEYSRPFKKNRLIFGNKEDGALVPFNQYWRTGANFSTDITVSDSFYFGDELLEKGSYWMYTIPGEESWKIFLNSESGSFAFFEPDETKNVASINVNSYQLDQELEQFTIIFIETDNKLTLRLLWDKTGISIPLN